MSTEMKGRWALVTGAGGEIGREIALQLGAAGVNVVATDLERKSAEQTAHAVQALGVTAEALQLDITEFDQVTARLGSLAKRVQGFDYLANVAGVYSSGSVEDISPHALESLFSVNVYGLFYVCRAVVPGMVERRRGAIVNFASVHGQKGYVNTSAYGATKGAVIALTRALAKEKGAFGIRVNAVAPGPINTQAWRMDDDGERLQRRIAERSRDIPLGRIGTTQEVASVAVFLLSPAAGFMTGQVLAVGGGEVM